VLELFWINSELKRWRKGQGFGCPGVRSCYLNLGQLVAIVEGGTALSSVHQTRHHQPRAIESPSLVLIIDET
jgi:hypothetical protein